MNVLFLTHAFPRAVGDPPGSFILRLAAALAHEGIAVTVVAPHAPGLAGRDWLQGIPVHRVRYAPDRFETLAYTGTMAEQVRTSWAARAALVGLVARTLIGAERQRRAVRPQLLHAHWWFPGGVAAALLSAFRHLPLVTTVHGSDVRLARPGSLAAALYGRVARRSSPVTAVSSWLATRAHALAPQLPTPAVAPMPAAVELFTPGGVRERDRLLFVGRLSAQKGPELLLRALAELPRGVTLDLVGDGPDAGALRTLAATLDLGHRVRWHGALPQPRLADFYRSAALLVVPSVDEGLGLVAVEAQLCETPVVAFDSGGLPDVVADGETGVLVREFNPSALAAGLRRVLEREDAGSALGVEGRRRALERFAPAAVARRYAGIYRDAISHSTEHKG